MFSPHRHIFGSGGDSPNVLAAAARLATSAAQGSAPPLEPGLLDSLRRDREHRSKVVVDRLSLVSSPNGILTAARAIKALRDATVSIDAAIRKSGTSEVANGLASENEGRPVRTRPEASHDQSGLPAPIPLRPAISTAVQVEIRELRALLSLDSRPLVSLSVSGLALEASRKQWWERNDGNLWRVSSPTSASADEAPGKAMTPGWPDWSFSEGRQASALRYVRFRLRRLSVLDLTTDGQLHHEVISHDGAGQTAASAAAAAPTPPSGTADRGSWNPRTYLKTTAAAPAPVTEQLPVVIEFLPARPDGRAVGKVNASVRGLRVCFLRRFAAELTKYFGPDGLGPVFAVAQSFSSGNPLAAVGVGEHDPNRRGDKLGVVGDEADAAIPDDWSVISDSSVSRSRGVVSNSDIDVGEQGTNNGTAHDGAQSPPNDRSVDRRREIASKGMHVTAVLEHLTVVLPRGTHSREAAAVRCEQLVLEAR